MVVTQPAATDAWQDQGKSEGDTAGANAEMQESAFVDTQLSVSQGGKKAGRIASMLPSRNKLMVRHDSKYRDESDSETDTDEDDDDEQGEGRAQAVRQGDSQASRPLKSHVASHLTFFLVVLGNLVPPPPLSSSSLQTLLYGLVTHADLSGFSCL